MGKKKPICIKYEKLLKPVTIKGKTYKYISTNTYTYWSKRYKKCVTVGRRYLSDGATGAIDIHSDCWWIHDVLCDRGTWDCGTPCTNWQASRVLCDIMIEEGRTYTRSHSWKVATFMFGGGEARKNGMFELVGKVDKIVF